MGRQRDMFDATDLIMSDKTMTIREMCDAFRCNAPDAAFL